MLNLLHRSESCTFPFAALMRMRGVPPAFDRTSAPGPRDPCRDMLAIPARRGALGAIRDLIDCHRINRIIRNTMQPVMLLHAESPAEHYRRILVPVDLAGPSGEAARDALLMLSPYAQIVFLQSFRTPNDMMRDERVSIEALHACKAEARAAAMLRLDRFVDSLDLGSHLVSRVTHHGDDVPLSAAYAARMNADLIVVGRPERLHPMALLNASPAWQLHKQVGCDVLIAAGAHCNPSGT